MEVPKVVFKLPLRSFTIDIIALIFAVMTITLALHLVFATSWSPEMWAVVIGSIITAITSSICAIISARSKARIEEHRAVSKENQESLYQIKKELTRNTSATERVEEKLDNK